MTLGKKIIQPPFLKAGDKVALISPAYWIAPEAITQAAETIKSWGLEPVIGAHAASLSGNAYAGTADERAADLLQALEDDSIKAIVCTRGGYGSIHLLNRIPLEYYQKYPKWIFGHGDITTLLYATASAGTMSVHGPMAFQIAANQEPASTIMRDILFGTIPEYRIPSTHFNRPGHAEGILIGGNLSSYSAIAGTKFHVPAEQDLILFIEEVEEALHSIDRLFYMLRLQLDFERVKGIVFGTFNSIKYDLQFGSVEQMLIEHLHDYDIPVCCGFPVGSNSSLPLIEGAPCSLDITAEESVLSFNVKGEKHSYYIEKDTPLIR